MNKTQSSLLTVVLTAPYNVAGYIIRLVKFHGSTGLLLSGGHLGRHLEKVKSETDIHPEDESDLIVQ